MSSNLVVDVDVQAVAEFMQTKIAASRLVSVAEGLAAMAPLLWGRYPPEVVAVLRLDAGAIASAEQTPAASI